MPRPRKSLISLSATPYYHCVSRCVRRAYLCGNDVVTGQSYEHRRQWVEDRLLFLARVFAIDVCAYAVMSNHTHVVLHVNQQGAMAWSDEEVLRRWHRIHKGMLCTRRYLDIKQRQTLSACERQTIKSLVNVYRKRLYDISWFMRLLNEYIARQANREDDCTGRFWEGRFKSQALLDDAALAACMAYVDLNPVRAGIATTPESSAHTSIRKRLRCIRSDSQPRDLMAFSNSQNRPKAAVLPFSLDDYLSLVVETGCCAHPQKRGRIKSKHSTILARIGLARESWQAMVIKIETGFGSDISLGIARRRLRFEQTKSAA